MIKKNIQAGWNQSAAVYLWKLKSPKTLFGGLFGRTSKIRMKVHNINLDALRTIVSSGYVNVYLIFEKNVISYVYQ